MVARNWGIPLLQQLISGVPLFVGGPRLRVQIEVVELFFFTRRGNEAVLKPLRNVVVASEAGHLVVLVASILVFNRGGAPGEIRTPDHLVRSPVRTLYANYKQHSTTIDSTVYCAAFAAEFRGLLLDFATMCAMSVPKTPGPQTGEPLCTEYARALL